MNQYRINQLIDKLQKIEVANLSKEEIQKSFTKEEQDILKVAILKVHKSNKDNLIKSISDVIEKSHLNDFIYSDKLLFGKTGKEIKDKLEIICDTEKREQIELRLKLSNILEKIGESPDKDNNKWIIDGYEDKGLDLPKIFDCYKLIDSSNSIPDKNNLKSEYDDYVREYIDSQKECIQIKTMIDNLKDNESYKLTIKQLSLLGF